MSDVIPDRKRETGCIAPCLKQGCAPLLLAGLRRMFQASDQIRDHLRVGLGSNAHWIGALELPQCPLQVMFDGGGEDDDRRDTLA
ncbi:MAG: hypothetical protein E5V58_04850 [Mesorhizobium sp.]|nr:MAG: hypothetical protein E5V58_04850 [Mesorhizobium sp.]